MERLHKSFLGQNIEEDGHNEITVITTLSGLGGIGKTTLAIHYTWKYYRNKFYFHVIWINAETADTIEKSFHAHAEKVRLITIGINGRPLELIDLAPKIYEYFEKTSTLFVYDNVEQHELVKPYLPVKSPKTTKQYVLITSRSREWNRETHLIDLDVFPEEDSVKFLKSYLNLETDKEMECAKKIARELQNLQLAMRQAGAYIEKVRSVELSRVAQVMKLYLELLQTNSKRIFEFKCDRYEKTINSTWKITLRNIKRQNYLAVRIMRIISYFNSNNIPIQLLQNIPNKRLFKRVWDSMIYKNSSINESSLKEAANLLSQFSMIAIDPEFNISVHRLVQKVIRDDVELVFERTILRQAMCTVETPLMTMCGTDYDQNCLVHAMSVSTHIPSSNLEPVHEQFIDFVISRRNNSTDVHTQRLVALLVQSKYDEAEESFYRTRDEYFSGRNDEGNVLTQVFTSRFINCVCKRIGNLFSKNLREGEMLKLSELCSKLLVRFKLSFGDLEHLRHFKESANLLKSARDNTSLTLNNQRSLVRTASQMYGSLFEYSIPRRNFPDVPEICGGVIDCLSYMERWTDVLKLFQSFYELSIEWFEFGNGEIIINAALEACDRIGGISRRINYETHHDVHNKLFEVTLKKYKECYVAFRTNENYESMLTCGLGRIECLILMNRSKDILEVIADMINWLN